MVIEPVSYEKSEAAARGLARRILEPMFSTHQIDTDGVLTMIKDAIGKRCALGNEKSISRFVSRLRRNLGPRFVSARYCPAKSRRKFGSGFAIITFGAALTPHGAAIKLLFSTVIADPGEGYRITTAEALTVPRHALERMIMRGGVRSLEDMRAFLAQVWRLNESMIAIKSAEFQKAEGRIMLPPVRHDHEGEVMDVVPILDRATGTIVTFLNDRLMGARRTNWLRRMIEAHTSENAAAKIDALLAESEVILAETRQDDAA